MSPPVDVIVRNGTVVSSDDRRELDIAIDEGRVVGIAPRGELREPARLDFDAAGLHVLPGVIDGHVHFREPGLTDKEDWGSGSLAAVVGGVTTVLDMPNTIPPTASADLARAKLALARARSRCDFGIFGLVTDSTLDELDPMARDGLVVGFKCFLGPTVGDIPEPTDDGLAEAMDRIAALGMRMGVHAEDRGIVDARIRELRAAGRRDALAHVESRPVDAEVAAIDRVGRLAIRTGCPVHVFHISSADGLAALEAWRTHGADITCELTPHHALLDTTDMARLGSVLRVNPPVRAPGSADALLDALADGRIDAIASDHAPHERALKLKSDIWDAVSGFSGVETSLPLFLTGAVATGRLKLERLVHATSEGPARTWGLWPRKGRISVGSDADLTIVDLARPGVIEGARLHGRSDVTPFEGWQTVGAPVATIVRGHIVMRDGESLGDPIGRPVSRGPGRPALGPTPNRARRPQADHSP